ncbi:hypothetical protein [Marinomonas sp. FW-1]|uniref:hypothetical protein n=1 Tax=Marinomonas sp. FW-1 TaxID=2071621 RepID=UPI0020C7F265|nr:hypothetical protein [Marinomonas sp. FW-1]
MNYADKPFFIAESIAVVPATDITAMSQTIRNYQQQLAKIQTNSAWFDQTIERIKNATGRHFGEGG